MTTSDWLDPQQVAAWANEIFREGPGLSAPFGGTAPALRGGASGGSAPDETLVSSGVAAAAQSVTSQPGFAFPPDAVLPYVGNSPVAPNALALPDAAPALPAVASSYYFLDLPKIAQPSEQSVRSVEAFQAQAPGYSAPGYSAPAYSAPAESAPAYSAPASPPDPLTTDLSRGVGVFDAATVARDFPILQERVNGKRLVWLDNAATTQKPQAVIDRLSYFYAHENSNVHRGAHTLAARSTDAYEAARDKVARFVNAPSSQEIVFVRGATEGINLVAQSWGRRYLRAGDEIIISWLEHHSNIVPWQLLCAELGVKLRVAPIDDSGQILLDEYERLFNANTRLVSFTHVSNALGTITPVKPMIDIAHRYGARVLVDGAQAVSHFPVDVQALDCDFYVFSGHKLFAPTGIGALYGKSELLNAMPPWQGGGNMIADVTFDKTVYNPAPSRFEAGTGNIADAVGLGAAIDYLDRIGMPNIARYEHDLLVYGTEQLLQIPHLRLIGTAAEKAGVLSFVIDGVPTEQIGAALAKEGIAVRSGHHCAQPALRRYGLESSVRPSLAFYNTCADVDALISVLEQLQRGW